MQSKNEWKNIQDWTGKIKKKINKETDRTKDKEKEK